MNTVSLQKFKDISDTFVNGKYILFEKKLDALLNAIAENTDIYNLISHCLKNFDFETEKNAATSSRVGFKMPQKSEKIVALAFCILSDIDEKKIDFHKFLTSYFKSHDINESFAEFNRTVVLPFKNTVIVLLEARAEELERAEANKPVVEEKRPSAEQQRIMDVIDELVEISLLKERTKHPSVILLAMKNSILNEEWELYKALKLAFFNVVRDKKFTKYAKSTLAHAEQ